MAFKYTTMQNFVKNVIQPPIRNILDLLESKMDTLKKYLIDKMDQLEKYLTDKMDALEKYLINFVNTTIAELRQEFIEFKNYVISLFDYRPEFPIGYIGNYYGELDTTKTHPYTNGKILTDWYVCNGENGTPDLRDKFIIGANDNNFNRNLGTLNHNHRISVSTSGSVQSTSLTVSQLPNHLHSISDRHTGIGAPGTPDKWPAGTSGIHLPVVMDCWDPSGTIDIGTSKAYAFADLSYNNTNSTGSGASHGHGLSVSSSASSENSENIPPCKALYFVMYKK